MLITIWFLALAALPALSSTVNCRCKRLMEPLNKTMWRLTISEPVTWEKVDDLCVEQFGEDFEMLGHDFLVMSDNDKALCSDQEVPLRLESDGGIYGVIWPESQSHSDVLVDDTYMEHADVPGTEQGPPTRVTCQGKYVAGRKTVENYWGIEHEVGSLNLSTGLWRLVNTRTKFACVICQQAWIDNVLNLISFPFKERPLPLNNAFTFRLMATGKNSIGVDEAISLAEERLNQTVGLRGRTLHAKIVKVSDNMEDLNGTLFRLKSAEHLIAFDVDKALNGQYSVKSWQDMDFCPATSSEGKDWEKTFRGLTASHVLQDFRMATRRCSWKSYPNGDLDAVWESDVLFWVDHEKACRTISVSHLVRRLQDYAKQAGPRDLDLKSLVEITADVDNLEIVFSREPNLTSTIFEILSLSIAKATNERAASACNGKACVFVSTDTHGVDRPDTLLVSSNEETPRFLNINESSATYQTYLTSVQLPRALTWERSVAVHTWQNLTFLSRRFDSAKRLLFYLVSSRPFNETEPERSRPVVTVRLNNSGYDLEEDYDYLNDGYSHLCVTSLGESGEFDTPCPWVRSEGFVDIYLCNKWHRGPRNDTVGSFLVNTAPYVSYLLLHRQLLGYTTVPVDEHAILRAAIYTNRGVLNPDDYTVQSVNDFYLWESILSGVVLTEPVFTASLDVVKVLLSNLTANDPVIGLSLARRVGTEEVLKNAASSRNKFRAKSEVDLVLGSGLQRHGQQLAMLAITKVSDFSYRGLLEPYIKRTLMVVYLVITSTSNTKEDTENEYFDIQLLGEKETEDEKGVSDEVDFDKGKSNLLQNNPNKSRSAVLSTMLRFQVATWSKEHRDWLVSSCSKLRSTRASKRVVRCERLTFADGQFRGRYLVFEPVGFAEAFGTAMLVVLIAAGFLSGMSLVSIVGTAATLPMWRKDVGHKILLHMALALWFNLALGFTSSFVSMDSGGFACIAVGALRHFSFLAMFAWMLLMSGLQLHRLLSVVGARGTPNLLLKISFIGWGVPALVVVLILTLNIDVYHSDAVDRGFCYPEDSAFTWLVQAPAATVLLLNFVIFMVILARIYGFFGWGKTQDLQRHLNEDAFQMARLRAVFFTFCLFGITWVFHLLAEYGVFQNKYLYEYLFLMTASIHVFMLSCIFVFCDQKARAEWAQVLAQLQDRLATLMAPLRDRLATLVAPSRETRRRPSQDIQWAEDQLKGN